MKVVALLASHNRREQTLACLDAYFSQTLPRNGTLEAVLVDDGSADGTAKAVRSRFPKAEVIEAGGDLYWAASMAAAEAAGQALEPDYLLWLNDDVELDDGSLATLIETAGPDSNRIAVGALRDPAGGELTYSGVRLRGAHPLRGTLISPAASPLPVDTFNGNVVLVPADLAARIGPIDARFAHSAADYDYGLRARELGIPALLAPGLVGICARGDRYHPWLDPELDSRTRLTALFGQKGMPPRSRARYLRRHGGALWPIFWLTPYLRVLVVVLRSRLLRTFGRRRDVA